MDIYNALGFVVFGALDVTLYRNIGRWLKDAIERPWPWLAIAKIAAAAALLLGVRHSVDVTWIKLLCAWLGGGLAAVGWQGANYAGVPNVDRTAKLSVAFVLGSFFSTFGWLGVKATLSPDLATLGVSLLQVAIAAAASMAVTVLANIVYDAIANRLAER